MSSLINEETLDLVAAEHRAGRRLFVGSTNLDANLFTIWNLGAIAGSSRPDRLRRYIDAIMASAAFPIAFQPVYIEVEGENGTYTQMHADGGVRETAFYFDFVEELYAAAEAAGLSEGDFKQEFYLLINGTVAHSRTVVYDPVGGEGKRYRRRDRQLVDDQGHARQRISSLGTRDDRRCRFSSQLHTAGFRPQDTRTAVRARGGGCVIRTGISAIRRGDSVGYAACPGQCRGNPGTDSRTGIEVRRSGHTSKSAQARRELIVSASF